MFSVTQLAHNLPPLLSISAPTHNTFRSSPPIKTTTPTPGSYTLQRIEQLRVDVLIATMENTTKNTSTSFQMDPPTDSSSIARKENETEHDSPNPNDSLEKIPRDFQQSAVQRLNTLASDCGKLPSVPIGITANLGTAQNAKGIFSPEPQASVAENNVTGTMKTGSAIAREETKQDETSSTVLGSARGALSPQVRTAA